jgi:hypothetical protein
VRSAVPSRAKAHFEVPHGFLHQVCFCLHLCLLAFSQRAGTSHNEQAECGNGLLHRLQAALPQPCQLACPQDSCHLHWVQSDPASLHLAMCRQPLASSKRASQQIRRSMREAGVCCSPAAEPPCTPGDICSTCQH